MSSRPELIGRLLETLLKLASPGRALNVEELAENALLSKDQVEKMLKVLGIPSEEVRLSEDLRLEVVLRGLELGVDGSLIARYLSWREFEKLVARVLGKAGYGSIWNLRISSREGRVQVDVLAYRGDLMLLIDCKRWNKPPAPSEEARIVEEQERRLRILRGLLEGISKPGEGSRTVYLVPVVLSLYQPSKPLMKGHVFSSIGSFESALDYIERAFFQLRHERLRIKRGIPLDKLVLRLRAGL